MWRCGHVAARFSTNGYRSRRPFPALQMGSVVMKHFVTRFLMSTAAALGLFFAAPAGAAGPVELNMYYPIAVGGALTKLVDDLVAGFERENPGIKVNAIYAGNYDDARIKALAALKSGKPAQLSVLFSIDIYELIEQ